jgi:hypothetical protein
VTHLGNTRVEHRSAVPQGQSISLTEPPDAAPPLAASRIEYCAATTETVAAQRVHAVEASGRDAMQTLRGLLAKLRLQFNEILYPWLSLSRSTPALPS